MAYITYRVSTYMYVTILWLILHTGYLHVCYHIMAYITYRVSTCMLPYCGLYYIPGIYMYVTTCTNHCSNKAKRVDIVTITTIPMSNISHIRCIVLVMLLIFVTTVLLSCSMTDFKHIAIRKLIYFFGITHYHKYMQQDIIIT